MTTEEAILIIEQHQKWRVGSDDSEMQSPIKITLAINIVTLELKSLLALEKRLTKKNKI